MQPETITLLRAKGARRACKIITPSGTRRYDHIKHWSYHPASIASLADFAALLTKLETDEKTVIIRDRPRHELAAGETVLKRKEVFESRPLQLVCFDIDKLAAPEGVSPISSDAIEYAVGGLPPAFRSASYVAQFSASAGREDQTIKLHLWFWLREAQPNRALYRWAESTNGLIDQHLFNAVQIHYTANPIFEGGEVDPFNGGSRVRFIQKQSDCVDWAPPPVKAAVERTGGEHAASEIVTDDEGKTVDGREALFVQIRWRILNDAKRPLTLGEFTARAWGEFCEKAVLGPTAKSSSSWDFERVAKACRLDWEKHGQVITAPETATVSVDEAEALVRHAVREAIEGKQIGVKVTVGAGKSTIAAQELAGKNVEIYAPTHAQQNEWEERTGGKTILGRNAKTCLRHAEVKALQSLGITADAALCKGTLGGAGKCVHFESCPYQAQFRPSGPGTRIYSHAHLTTPRKSFAPPDIAVIDEGFLSSAIDTTDFNLGDLNAVAARISDNWEQRAAVEAITAVARALESPDAMLDRLRRGGVSAEALRDAAKIVSKMTPRLALRAGESVETLKRRVTARRRASFVLMTRLFRALARELETGRRGAHSVMRTDEGFRFCRRLPLKRLEGVERVLLLDADLERESIVPFFPEIEIREIEVRQNLHVTQISDLSLSRAWLGLSEGNPDEGKIAELCERVRPMLGERPLIVTYKGLVSHLRKRLPAKCRFEHFGNTRGTNAYKDCDSVVVIGRQFPSSATIEAQARALHFDAAEPLTFETARGWRAAGSESALPSFDFIDRRVQALMEVQREAETRQAVGRLRGVWSQMPKKVYLISSQPVPGLKPDRLVKYERSKAEVIYSHLGGWLPLNPKLLVKFAGGYFPRGERQALKWRDKVQDPQALYVSIVRRGLETGTPTPTHGRERGTRGARKFKIWVDPLIHPYPEHSLAAKADLIVDPLPWARPRRGTPPFELPLGFEVMCLPDRRPSWVRRLAMARQSRLAIDWYEPLHARSQWYWNPPLVWRAPSPDFRICEPQERSYDAAA